MQTKEKENLIIIRLFPDQDLFKDLKEACKKHRVETAVVISGLGQLKKFELGYFKEKGNYVPQLFKEPHELLSLTGNISKQNDEYNFHLHAVLGNVNKQVVGGHLFKGVVEVTNEIVLLKTDIIIKRKVEEKTGLQGMFLE
ncbi:MAG: PPC domain-containing DNA-binding protein [Planctomycetota bacterium]|jgi:predicted DNA-binding protein with PD1-like motif